MRILISGGARGIGAACVRDFASDGPNVAFIYRSAHEAAEKLADECGATAICADISKPDEAREAVAKAIEALGGIDVLVNNAGIAQIKMFCDITDEDLANMLNTNLSSAFYVIRAALPSMVSQKWGRIINIGSMWGKVGASCEVAYSATKAGVRGLTMAMAKELAPSGITVNCIEPGVIDTDMNRALDEATRRSLADEIPVGRFGTPAEVADAVFFFASQESAFITGQILGVDGGMAIG